MSLDRGEGMARPQKFGDKWRIRWTTETGRRHSAVFSTHREADVALKLRQAEVERIKAGEPIARPEDRTVGTVLDYWLEHRARYKRSQKDDESIIRCHLRPKLGGIKLATLSIIQIDAFRAGLSHLAPKTVRNILTLLQSALRLGEDLNWLGKTPRISKPKVNPLAQDYRYLRNHDEVRRFLYWTAQKEQQAHTLYLTAIFTGMRAGELAALTWSKVDFANQLITVAHSFDGPTKSGRVRYVPILDPLKHALRDHKVRMGGNALVFPNTVGKMHGPSACIFQEVLHRVLRAAGFPKSKDLRGRNRHYIRFHDLRHTFASYWMRAGGDMFKLQKILGHASPQMTMRYAHLSPDVYQTDHDRFAMLDLNADLNAHSPIVGG